MPSVASHTLRFKPIGFIVSPMSKFGTVYFVGIGPGDPGLMTLRAAESVRKAEVLVYEIPTTPEIVPLAQQNAERIVLGKDSKSSPEDVAHLLVSKAKEGKNTARLVSGDPFFDPAATTEISLVARAGIRFEVVPGLSFALAAPARIGIPLLHPESKTGFSILATTESDLEGNLDWDWLCRAAGTRLVIGRFDDIDRLANRLVSAGLNPDTPVALVRPTSSGNPQSVSAPLRELPSQAAAAAMKTASVVVIGDVVSLRSNLNWAEKLPLAGQRIAVTRARDQAGDLTKLLTERGAEVLEVPCIRIEPPTQPKPLAEALAGLGCYDWIVFTSVNGVTAFFEHFFRVFEDLRDLGGVRIAAVGPSTAARLKALHLKVDLVPKHHTAAAIAHELAEMGSLENLRILLPRAEVATPELPALLEDKGAIVDDIACYRTVAETEDVSGAAAQLSEHGADWITFTSGSTVEQCHCKFNLPELKRRFPGLKLASIGPETTKALAALSLKADLEARPHTLEALVAGVERLARQSHS